MPVNHKFKTIFVHIPKCAGTSVTQMLDMTTLPQMFFCGSPGMYASTHKQYSDKFSLLEYTKLVTRPPQHFTFKEISKILDQDIISTYYIFTVVRNPYARLASAYNKAIIRNSGKTGFDSFENFLKTQLVLPEYNRASRFQGHLETQTSYLKNDNGIIDPKITIFKFENFQECYAKISEIYPNVPLLHANKSPQSYDYKTYYTPELLDIAYEFYKDDFNNFGYSRDINL